MNFKKKIVELLLYISSKTKTSNNNQLINLGVYNPHQWNLGENPG